jgi:hypothetical protein
MSRSPPPPPGKARRSGGGFATSKRSVPPPFDVFKFYELRDILLRHVCPLDRPPCCRGTLCRQTWVNGGSCAARSVPA